jgi:hypothetical protein
MRTLKPFEDALIDLITIDNFRRIAPLNALREILTENLERYKGAGALGADLSS